MYAVRTYDAPWIIYDWRGETKYPTLKAAVAEARLMVADMRKEAGRPLYQDGSFYRDRDVSLRYCKGGPLYTRIYIVG